MASLAEARRGPKEVDPANGGTKWKSQDTEGKGMIRMSA